MYKGEMIKLILIGENPMFNQLAVCLESVTAHITNLQEASKLLNEFLYHEIPNRGMLFDQTIDKDGDPVLSLPRYNREMCHRGTEECMLPTVIIVIGNMEEMLAVNMVEMQEAIRRIKQLGNQYGIFIIEEVLS